MRGEALPGNRWDLLEAVRPEEPPRVSVIVAHYRQPEQLSRTLAALRAQDHPADRLEIIVADDGSPEPPSLPRGVVLARQEDDGFRLAAVRNLGVARATGDVLVFLDADTVPEPGYVRELTRLPALAGDIVTVGRRRHADFTGLPVDAHPALARALEDPVWLADGYRATRDLLDADDRSYRFVIGAVLACTRALYDEVGGFDESFTAYGGEDWEWAYRAWVRGAMLAHVPTAVAWHDGPDFAGRGEDAGAANAEAMRLADLIPVSGSRPRGLPPAKIDMLVSGSDVGTAAARFVALDSAVAALPGAETPPSDRARADRVRLEVRVLRPALFAGDVLARAVEWVSRDRLGSLTLTADGQDVLRITSVRAAARARRWGRDDLFADERDEACGVVLVDDDVDVAGYLGGWGAFAATLDEHRAG